MRETYRPALRSLAAKQGCFLVAASLFLSSECAHPQAMVQFYNYIPGFLVTHIYAPNSADICSWQIGNGLTDTPIGSTDWSAFMLIGANGTAGPFAASTTLDPLLAAPGSSNWGQNKVSPLRRSDRTLTL
jgi:hypothetical protein